MDSGMKRVLSLAILSTLSIALGDIIETKKPPSEAKTFWGEK